MGGTTIDPPSVVLGGGLKSKRISRPPDRLETTTFRSKPKKSPTQSSFTSPGATAQQQQLMKPKSLTKKFDGPKPIRLPKLNFSLAQKELLKKEGKPLPAAIFPKIKSKNLYSSSESNGRVVVIKSHPTRAEDVDSFTFPFKRGPRTPTFGHIDGVPIGMKFHSFKDMFNSSVHLSIQSGIAGWEKDGGAQSIVLNGKCENTDMGDVFCYVGEGGRTSDCPKGKQDQDQLLIRGNKGLELSMLNKRPVRVIRGFKLRDSIYSPKRGYRYDGLYNIVKMEYKMGRFGFNVYLFHFVRIGDQDPPPWEDPDADSEDNEDIKEVAAYVTTSRFTGYFQQVKQEIKDEPASDAGYGDTATRSNHQSSSANNRNADGINSMLDSHTVTSSTPAQSAANDLAMEIKQEIMDCFRDPALSAEIAHESDTNATAMEIKREIMDVFQDPALAAELALDSDGTQSTSASGNQTKVKNEVIDNGYAQQSSSKSSDGQPPPPKVPRTEISSVTPPEQSASKETNLLSGTSKTTENSSSSNNNPSSSSSTSTAANVVKEEILDPDYPSTTQK